MLFDSGRRPPSTESGCLPIFIVLVILVVLVVLVVKYFQGNYF